MNHYLCVYEENEKSLLELLQEDEVKLESPCGGNGTCGKCKVKIIEGIVNKPLVEEINHLSKEELDSGIRLACLVYPKGDITVDVLYKKERNQRVLAEGYIPEFEVNPVISKRVYTLKKPTLENNVSYETLFSRTVKNLKINNLEILKQLHKVFEEEKVTVIYDQDEIIGIEPEDTTESLYGIAVDIGTTTIVVSLVDLKKGVEIQSETAINPQTKYGLDVLSRIDFVRKKENGVDLLHKAMIDCLNTLIEKLCNKNHVSSKKIYEMTIAANSTMMHLFLGIDTASIGKSPYVPVFASEQNFSASLLGINSSPFAKIYCLSGVSSYIGADIVAGVGVCDLDKRHKNILFIDIGTNGEIVLSKKGELSSCSCAAGPALEGMNISCGMRAAQGAIEGVEIKNDNIHLKVIEDTSAIGICGSGILEAISEMLRVGLVNKAGRIKSKESIIDDENLKGYKNYLTEVDGKRRVLLGENIWVTQGDIRQVQLAKGAILSGFYSLLNFMNIDMKDLDEVIIAGQFGKHLKVDSLIGVGIIPDVLKEKVRYIGNSSKTGALMCLLSHESRKKMEKLSKQIHYFELSTDENYEKLFTKCLSFKK
ncbi:DUF4445 domain-containing protein [Lutibacter sp. B2]|nr:DUF4445 domain-containing protein [Lutibacter sp. B2]